MPSPENMVWLPLLRDHLSFASRPLLVILGPTASGKTVFSLDVADKMRQENFAKSVEIVNADSRQLYKFLDIGTAKIRIEEMRDIPHHLLDVLDPRDPVTIAWYKERATAAIDDILARGGVPMLVGGSMLYISSIIDGLEPLETVDPNVRRSLEDEYDSDSGEALYRELEQGDPVTASSFHRNNRPYVVRAVELLRTQASKPSAMKKKSVVPYDLFILGMQWDIDDLRERIDERTRTLLQSGWTEEVESLLARGYLPTDPGMKSHGYREIVAWLNSEERNMEELHDVISRKTKAYAKRQMTWWKDDPRIHWKRSSL